MALSKYWKDDLCTWAVLAGKRALKTFAQTFAGFLTVGCAVGEVAWGYAASVAAVAAAYSLATSVAGIPELDDGTSLPQIMKED